MEHRAGPSIKDVAERAGVSLGTVSNALNRPAMVRPETRERVLRAVADLGYIRNEGARQLRAGRSRTVVFVMLDASPFFTDVSRGMEEVLGEQQLALYLSNSDQNDEREARYLDLLLEQRVHGVLITPTSTSTAKLQAVASMGTPVVLVDRQAEQGQLCSVSVDDVLGGELAALHLLEIGRRKLCFVGGPAATPQLQDRLEGVRRAAASASGVDQPQQLSTDALTVAQGREAGSRLVGMPAGRRPDAVVCGNDLIALGMLQRLIELGVSVPDDIALVGYDDIEFASAAAVPLTTVRQPRMELGRTAANLLLRESGETREEHRHEQIVFPPDLVVRQSTVNAARTIA